MYRLDWTSDGRPNEVTAKLSKGVGTFFTELQPDLASLHPLKFRMPPIMVNATIDQAQYRSTNEGCASPTPDRCR